MTKKRRVYKPGVVGDHYRIRPLTHHVVERNLEITCAAKFNRDQVDAERPHRNLKFSQLRKVRGIVRIPQKC
jgi:hypothetical protein